MKFENEIVLERHQTASLRNGEHTHIVIGKHDDGTPAFARLSADQASSVADFGAEDPRRPSPDLWEEACSVIMTPTNFHPEQERYAYMVDLVARAIDYGRKQPHPIPSVSHTASNTPTGD